MYKECDIVKDLIPLYAEKLLNDGSEDLVEEHCTNCKDCKNELEIAVREIESDEDKYSEKMQKVWANIAHQERKQKKRQRIIKISLISFAVLVVVFVYSFILHGNTWFTKVDFNVAENYEDSSIVYAQSMVTHPGKDQVEEAVKDLKDYFRENMEGYVLLDLKYDSENTFNKNYGNGEPDLIVFEGSYFDLTGHAASEQFETKSYWRWALQYNGAYNKWIVVMCGY